MSKIALTDIEIRNTLEPGDLAFIAYVHATLYAEECGYGLNFESYVLEGLANFGRAYHPKKDKVWVCLHDGEIIGSLFAQHRDQAVQLRYFICLPQYRGIGLGKCLLNEFVAFMNETGTRHAYLWTTEEQHTAISLYERFGFKLTDQTTSDVFSKPIVERKYELKLA